MDITHGFSIFCWINMALAFYLFLHGVCKLNMMSTSTPSVQKLGYVALTVGSFAGVLAPAYGCHSPKPSELLINTGLVLYFAHYTAGEWKAFLAKTLQALRK